MHHAEFEDPRVVAVYNQETPWSREDEFFTSIVDDFAPPSIDGSPQHVLDLGCGTGRLAMGVAARGYRVTGVDPARASLDIARSRPGANRATWIEGTSALLTDATFVAAVMTSHVSQFFLTDTEWANTLDDLHRALVPSGIITFDMRDARAREWDTWTHVDSRHEVVMPDGRVVVEWTEITEETTEAVSFRTHYVFADGQDLVSTATLRFRDEGRLRTSLSEAGFVVEEIFGGWDREPVGHKDGELLVVARKE